MRTLMRRNRLSQRIQTERGAFRARRSPPPAPRCHAPPLVSMATPLPLRAVSRGGRGAALRHWAPRRPASSAARGSAAPGGSSAEPRRGQVSARESAASSQPRRAVHQPPGAPCCRGVAASPTGPRGSFSRCGRGATARSGGVWGRAGGGVCGGGVYVGGGGGCTLGAAYSRRFVASRGCFPFFVPAPMPLVNRGTGWSSLCSSWGDSAERGCDSWDLEKPVWVPRVAQRGARAACF